MERRQGLEIAGEGFLMRRIWGGGKGGWDGLVDNVWLMRQMGQGENEGKKNGKGRDVKASIIENNEYTVNRILWIIKPILSNTIWFSSLYGLRSRGYLVLYQND